MRTFNQQHTNPLSLTTRELKVTHQPAIQRNGNTPPLSLRTHAMHRSPYARDVVPLSPTSATSLFHDSNTAPFSPPQVEDQRDISSSNTEKEILYRRQLFAAAAEGNPDAIHTLQTDYHLTTLTLNGRSLFNIPFSTSDSGGPE